MRLAKVFLLGIGFCFASSLFADTTVTFDELGPQPTEFNDAQPLTTQYHSLGLTFSGGGAILDQGSHFGVSTLSGDDFLAFNTLSFITNADGSHPAGPETLTFKSPVTSVSIWGGSGGSVNFELEAFDAAGNFVQGDFAAANRGYVDLAVSGKAISSVTFFGDGQAYVFDNLSFAGISVDHRPSGIPDNSSTWFALSLGLLSLAAIRRLTQGGSMASR
ncbi:MAG TPA: hypothetical protein VGO59_12615 [Verrucomicrobiae bacterium]|jgi:hypothetical protein